MFHLPLDFICDSSSKCCMELNVDIALHNILIRLLISLFWKKKKIDVNILFQSHEILCSRIFIKLNDTYNSCYSIWVPNWTLPCAWFSVSDEWVFLWVTEEKYINIFTATAIPFWLSLFFEKVINWYYFVMSTIFTGKHTVGSLVIICKQP